MWKNYLSGTALSIRGFKPGFFTLSIPAIEKLLQIALKVCEKA
jgi:hypothetical protein